MSGTIPHLFKFVSKMKRQKISDRYLIELISNVKNYNTLSEEDKNELQFLNNKILNYELRAKKYFPGRAFNYILQLLIRVPSILRLYKCNPDGMFSIDRLTQIPVIHINNTLNKYGNLMIFILQYSHAVMYEYYGVVIPDTNRQWRCVYSDLFDEAIKKRVFPPDLAKHINNYTNLLKICDEASDNLHKAIEKRNKNTAR